MSMFRRKDMSRNRIKLHRDLESYLDDLIDEVQAAIDDQMDHPEDEIRRLRIREDKTIQVVAQMFEWFVFEDDMPEMDAIEEATKIVVDTAIYTALDNARRLQDIPKDLEDELYDAKMEFEDITDEMNGRRGGRDRDRDRGRNRRSKSRREAASGDREERSERRRKNRDDKETSRRGNREAERESRKNRRENRKENSVVEDKVQTAQSNIDSNKEIRLTLSIYNAAGLNVSKNDISPVYYLGDQIPYIVDGDIVVRQEQEVEWERHRTDLYLSVRSKVKPSSSIRQEALKRAINSRKVRLEEIVDNLISEGNVVQLTGGNVPLVDLTAVIGTSDWYGNGNGITMLRNAFNNQIEASTKDKENAIVPKFSLQSPATATIRRFPMWTFNKETYLLMKELVNLNSINELIEIMIKLSNSCTPEQWAYVHDIVTSTVSEMMRICIGSRAYLDSIIVEWADFVAWLQNFEKGAYIKWVEANIGVLMQRAFNLRQAGEVGVHATVDGTDSNYGSTYYVTNLMYLPIPSEHLGLASPTKLGRVLESVTPSLYSILSGFVDPKVYENLLVTQSNEVIRMYGKFGSIEGQEIYMGELA